MNRPIRTLVALALSSSALAGCASMAPEHVRPEAATAPAFDPEYRPDGEVVLTRARDESSQDPVMASFLAFLERDLQEHPENIRPVTASTFAEAERLTAGIEVDLDEELPEDDDDT